MDRKLNEMIDSADNVELIKEPHWFKDWTNQHRLIYKLGCELLTHAEVTPQEAVDTSKEFHDIFYNRILRF